MAMKSSTDKDHQATDILTGHLSRRALFQRAGALGLGASATMAFLAACGSTAQTAAGTETLTFVNSDNSLPNAIGAYNKTYPHLKFNVVTSGWGPGGQDMKEKELVMMSGGNYPDLAMMVWMKEFARNDLLLDLTDIAKTWDVYPHLAQGQLGRMTYNGRLYGLTLGNNCIIQFYNKDILQRVGMTGPLTTLDQVMELAHKIKAANLTTSDGKPIYAVTFDGGNWATDYWLWAGGGSQMNNDYTKTLIDSPESIAAYTFMQSFVKMGAAPKPDGTAQQLWLNGQVAFYPSGFWDAPASAQTKMNWDVAVMPKGPTGLNTVSIGGIEYAVFKKSPYQQEALSVIKAMASAPWQLNTNPKTAADFTDLSAYDNPGKQAAWKQQGTGVLNSYLTTRDQVKQSSRYNFLEAPFVYPDASSTYNTALQEILVNLADPASTMKDAATQINQGISDALNS